VFRDEAQIATAGLDFGCFGLEFVAREVEVYLLGAEFEGVTVFCLHVLVIQYFGIAQAYARPSIVCVVGRNDFFLPFDSVG
jgi:hypothetical protein